MLVLTVHHLRFDFLSCSEDTNKANSRYWNETFPKKSPVVNQPPKHFSILSPHVWHLSGIWLVMEAVNHSRRRNSSWNSYHLCVRPAETDGSAAPSRWPSHLKWVHAEELVTSRLSRSIPSSWSITGEGRDRNRWRTDKWERRGGEDEMERK